MKGSNRFLATVLSCCALLPAMGAFAVSIVPPPGLVSWWKGQNNATDAQGASTATLVGGVVFSAGKTGNAFSFDGSTARVDTNLDVQPSAMPSTTWDAWVYPTTSTPAASGGQAGRQTILSDDDGGYDRTVVQVGSNFGVATGTAFWEPVAVTLNQWQHIAVVFTPSNIYFYKNGVQYTYGSAPTGGGTGKKFTIGASPFSGYVEYFNGLIDEVDVFNRALAPAEIQAIYNADSSGKAVVIPGQSMISWWSGDGNGLDIQGTNHGTLINSLTFGTGKVGQAFNIDPANARCVRIPDSPSLRVRTLTIDAWVNFNNSNPGHAQHILDKAIESSNFDSYALWYDAGELRGATKDGSGFYYLGSGQSIAPNSWHHVAYTFDGATHALYVDGVLKNSAPNTHYPTYDDHAVLIGADYPGDTNSTIDDFFDGQLDEVHLFDRALNAGEIQAIYNAGSTGLSHLPALTITDAAVTPGSSGTTNATFTVNVARFNSSPITVFYETIDSTAVQPADYTYASGTLNIPANTASATFTVPVIGSASLTQRKTFFVNLRNPTNAIVNNAYATGTILTGNAVQDFSISTNTNTSTDTWQYGGVALDGSGFIRDTDNTGSINAGAIIAWKTPNSLGGITFNTSGVNQYYNIHTNQPADELGMFAGTGDKAILRWLAPASGTYAVTGLFRAIDQSDADVAIIKNENVAVGAALFSDIVLGNQNAKPFSLNVTVNAGDTLDFRVGFGNDGFSYSGTSLKVSITQNVGPPPLPAITTVSKTGPNTPGGNIHFACTTQAGLNGAVGSAAGNVRVQYTTDATFAEGNWTDIPNGTATEGTAGSYTLDTTAYPLASGVYFRFVSTKNGFTDGKSGNTLLGPFNLSNTIVFGETDPTTPGGPIKFHATTAPGWVVRVQTTTKAAPVEVDWSDLNDGNSGHMTESGTTPGSYSLDSTSYPAGAAVSFRAIASKATFTDVVSVRLVVSNLRQAALSIGATLSSSSDWAAGRTAYIDDYLIYKLTVKNSGDGNAKTLKVTATVPTFLYADIPVLVRTVAGSNIIALASGNTSQLMLGGTFASGPGTGGAVVGNPNGTKFYIPLTATITAINPDGMHFTISQPAINSSGTSTVSLLVQYGSARKQFLESDLSLSPGGAYVPETSPGAGNAKLVWNNIGDLPGAPGLVYSQYVTFSVHLTSKVRTEQALGIGNDYSVASTASPVQPMAGSTGFLSNAPNPSCQINGSISFLLSSVSTNPRSNPLAAAPGGYITYTFVLFNRGTSAATNPVAVVEMPDFTRFAASYDNGMKGVFVTSGTVASKLVYHTGSPVPQVVLKFSSLAAKTSLQVQVVFQVKWADPADVSKISTINYGAAFLDNLNPKPISAANAFLTLFNIASVNPLAPTTTDFFTLVGDPTDKLARSLNQSGVIDVALRGSLDDEPVLDVFKQISNTLTKTVNAGDGSNSLDVVRTGEKLTFIIALSNNGPSPAEEVYVTERMPDHCTYVAKSAVLSGATTPSKTKSTLVCTPDADGHHLVFTGMHMEPYDTVTFTYTVLVDASLVVPAPTDPPLLLEVGPFSCGSGSITHTPEGFATSLFIRVIGTTNLYAQPYSTLLVPTPQVILNADKKTTSDTLDVLYLRTPSAQPLKDQKAVIDPTHPPVYIDGVERIYIHYENFGNAGASGVKVTFPVLANTAFYRASWVTLTPNPNPGAMPTMPGTIIKPPTGGSITAPAKGAESGDVVFNLTTLAAGGKGDVMVEFLVLASGVQATSAHAGNGTEMITITDSLAAAAARPAPRTSGTRTQDVPLVPLIGAHQSQALAGVLRLDSSYLAAHGGLVPPTPTFSVMRQISKQNVIPGEKFTITLLGMNNGGVDCIPLMLFRVPDNTVLISVGDYIPDFPRSQPGQLYGQALYSHNNSANGSLKPHTAGGYVITLQATAAAGNSIVLSGTHMDLPNHDSVAVAPATINIVDAATLANRANPDHFQVFGCSFSQLNNGVRLIELGGGNVIAQGGGNVIAQGGGNLLGQDGSGVVAQGGGNLIAVQNPSTLGFVSTSSLLANNSYAITSAKIGNLVVQATTAVIAQGGGNVVAQGGGNLVPPVSSNVVAQGGGNVIGNGSAGVIGNGSAGVIGNGSAGVVAQGGGNVVAQGGGNVVAAGGGNVVAQGGGNLLAGGGNVIGEHSNGIIGEHSNGVIGEHSSGVIGNGSAGIVSAGGGN